MDFKEYLRLTCEHSSIHGLPYLVKPELHWFERVFWCAMIFSATYFSIDICLNQWERFRNNPIIYAFQLTWDKSDFPYGGATLCSDYHDKDDLEALIETTWGIGRNYSSFAYYLNFLLTLNVLRYDTMHTLAPYANDTTLKDLHFVEMLLTMRQRLHPPRTTNNNDDELKTNQQPSINNNPIYAPAITEAGLCRTTSQLNEYTNPYGELKHLPVTGVRFCGFLNECTAKIFPMVNDDNIISIYIHNVYDIVAPNERSTVLREIKADGSLIIELLLNWTTAEAEVRNLPIAYRKCRYPDENNLSYFKLYRPGLCRIECRINAALKKCNCKPYFYAVAPNAPICDIDGMLCLARNNWTDTHCDCMPLCDDISYTSEQSTEQKDDHSNFEHTIIAHLTLPRMAIKRRVVFRTYQLVVAFGGAVGLFLGASFMSAYTLLFIFSEYVILNVMDWWARRKNRTVGHAVKAI